MGSESECLGGSDTVVGVWTVEIRLHFTVNQDFVDFVIGVCGERKGMPGFHGD